MSAWGQTDLRAMNEPQSGQLLFDAFGTLIYPEPDAASVYFDFGRRFGDSRSLETIRQLFKQSLAKFTGPSGNLQTDPSTEIERWKNIVEAVFGHLPIWESLFTQLWQHFGNPQHWRLYPDTGEILVQLYQYGFDLSIASNFDSRLFSICKGLEPLNHICRIFISAELGWRKPSAQFFQAIAKQLPASSQPIWMIGDNWELDIAPAQACGWNAVYLDRHRTGPETILSNQTICIDSLRQLPAILDAAN